MSASSGTRPAALALAAVALPAAGYLLYQALWRRRVRGAALSSSSGSLVRPVIVGTWRFGAIAVREAGRQLDAGKELLDAVELGVNALEMDTEDQYYVGFGGLPNSDGVMQVREKWK